MAAKKKKAKQRLRDVKVPGKKAAKVKGGIKLGTGTPILSGSNPN